MVRARPASAFAYDRGSMTGAHLAQLLLDRVGVPEHLCAAQPDSRWQGDHGSGMEPCVLTLLKTAIELKYGSWRLEGSRIEMSRRVLCFPTPPAQPLTFPPQSDPTTFAAWSFIPKWTAKVAQGRRRSNRSGIARETRARSACSIALSSRRSPASRSSRGLQQRADRTVRNHRGALDRFLLEKLLG